MISVLPLLMLLAAGPEVVPTPPATTPVVVPAPRHRHFGIGYKAGDGIGFLGADLLISPIPHLTFDLFTSEVPFASTDATLSFGYALAPSVQFHLLPDVHSPYAAAGYQYVQVRNQDVTGTATGYFGNVGYEWRWGGAGILLGIGVQHLKKIVVTNGSSTVTFGGSTNANLELGFRYYIF